jgi:hypothetical protein
MSASDKMWSEKCIAEQTKGAQSHHTIRFQFLLASAIDHLQNPSAMFAE